MNVTVVLILATLAVCGVYLLVIGLRAYWRVRGPMVVTCPETHQPAAVTVDASHAGLTAAVDATELRLSQCSRWPERQGCGQECLRQIEVAPEDCMVRTILSTWYADKSCVLCGAAIGPIHAWDHRPGLMAADGTAMECTAVPAERLQAELDKSKPLCWNCEVTEEFRRRNADLVIDKPAFHLHPGRHGKVA
jgi:hypothetical protein